jgi:hypothetical protein
MSISPWLKERFGQRVQYKTGSLVESGSPVEYRLSAGTDFWQTVFAAIALAKRHLPMSQAKKAVERLVAGEVVIVTVPCVEDTAVLERELAELNVEAMQTTGESNRHRTGAAAE